MHLKSSEIQHSLSFEHNLGKILDRNSAQFGIFLIEDLNSETTEKHIEHFCDIFYLKNLVKEPTSSKHPNKTSCIDLFLTNCSKSFKDTQVVEAGLSEFYKIKLIVLKNVLHKIKPINTVFYRNYKTFDRKKLRTKLENELEKFDKNNVEFQTFNNILLSVLNEYIYPLTS